MPRTEGNEIIYKLLELESDSNKFLLTVGLILFLILQADESGLYMLTMVQYLQLI